MKPDNTSKPPRMGRSRSPFIRDFRFSAIVAAIVCAVLMIVRASVDESSGLVGPFSFLPAWPFYSRLGIPVVALTSAFAYSVVAAAVRYLRNR